MAFQIPGIKVVNAADVFGIAQPNARMSLMSADDPNQSFPSPELHPLPPPTIIPPPPNTTSGTGSAPFGGPGPGSSSRGNVSAPAIVANPPPPPSAPGTGGNTGDVGTGGGGGGGNMNGPASVANLPPPNTTIEPTRALSDILAGIQGRTPNFRQDFTAREMAQLFPFFYTPATESGPAIAADPDFAARSLLRTMGIEAGPTGNPFIQNVMTNAMSPMARQASTMQALTGTLPAAGSAATRGRESDAAMLQDMLGGLGGGALSLVTPQQGLSTLQQVVSKLKGDPNSLQAGLSAEVSDPGSAFDLLWDFISGGVAPMFRSERAKRAAYQMMSDRYKQRGSAASMSPLEFFMQGLQ